MEYDLEVAKRVYGEELLEDRNVEIAKKLLRMGLSKEQISEATGLSHEDIVEIESGLL